LREEKVEPVFFFDEGRGGREEGRPFLTYLSPSGLEKRFFFYNLQIKRGEGVWSLHKEGGGHHTPLSRERKRGEMTFSFDGVGL